MNIIFSSGIRGVDWSQSLNLLAEAECNVSHFSNVTLEAKNRYDDVLFDASDDDNSNKKDESELHRYFSHLIQSKKSYVNFLSDADFIDGRSRWKHFAKESAHVFFFCSPEYYLAKYESNAIEVIDQEQRLNTWLEDVNKIWNFYICSPDNTLLINVEDVERNAALTGSKIIEFCGFEIDNADIYQVENKDATTLLSPVERLSFLILQNTKLDEVKANDMLNEGYENLVLSSLPIREDLIYQVKDRSKNLLLECQNLSIDIAFNQMQAESKLSSLSGDNSDLVASNEKILKSMMEIKERESLLHASNKRGVVENELAGIQISQLQKELDGLDANFNDFRGEFTGCTAKLEAHNAELVARNELALLQIELLQGELERNSAENESQKTELLSRKTELLSRNELTLSQVGLLREELERNSAGHESQKAELLSQNESTHSKVEQLQEAFKHCSEKYEDQIEALKGALQYSNIQHQKMIYSPSNDSLRVSNLDRLKHGLSLIAIDS